MSTRFSRPTGAYAGQVGLSNRDKYQQDSAATPKRAISSPKMDGDFNYLIAAANALDDDITSLVGGSVPDKSISNAKLRDSAAFSVVGRAGNSAGSVADISAGSDNLFFGRLGSALGFFQIPIAALTSSTALAGQYPQADGIGGVSWVTSPYYSAITINDTAPGRLNGKLLVGNGIQKDLINPGGAEQLSFSLIAATNATIGGVILATLANIKARTANRVVTADQLGRQSPFIVAPMEGAIVNAFGVISADGKALFTGRGIHYNHGAGVADVETHGLNELNIPVQNPDDYVVVQYIGGGTFSYVLLANGDVYGVGTSATGSLGAANMPIFARIPFPEAIKKIFTNYNSGGYYTAYGGIVALAKTTTNAYGMGYNNFGQAAGGNGNTVTPQNTPQLWANQYDQVWPMIDAYGCVYALDSAKKLWGWGKSYNGSLGNQSANQTDTSQPNRVAILNIPQTTTEYPIFVASRTVDITATAGEQFPTVHIALTNLGGLWLWGFHGTGSTSGFGTSGGTTPGVITDTVPAPYKLLNSGDAVIANKNIASCGIFASYTNRGFWLITTDKTLYTWGYIDGTASPIGQGATVGSKTPAIPVPVGLNGISETFVGTVEEVISSIANTNTGEWSAVRLTNGHVYACGYNNNANLGLGDTVVTSGIFKLVPASLGRNIVRIFVVNHDDQASLGMIDDKGAVWTVGNNSTGQKGLTNPAAVTKFTHQRALVC